MICHLSGSRILVTRPFHQAEGLCRLIEQAGGIPVRFPTMAIVGTDSPSGHATGMHLDLSKYHYFIFTSANAVNFALKAIDGKIGQFLAKQIAAIGQATAKELIKHGIRVDIVPDAGFDSESLLAMPQLQSVLGDDVLIVRGQGGREEIAITLKDRGAKVDFWEVYRRVMPDTDPRELENLLALGKLDAVVVTSIESLQNLIAMTGENYNNFLTAVPLFVISKRIMAYATERGFTQVIVTDSPSDESVVGKIIAFFNGEQSG